MLMGPVNADSQSQSRKSPRAYPERRNANQARQDQGRPRETTGAYPAEETGISRWGRGADMIISITVDLEVGLSDQQQWFFNDGDAIMSHMMSPSVVLCKLECQHMESIGSIFLSTVLNMQNLSEHHLTELLLNGPV